MSDPEMQTARTLTHACADHTGMPTLHTHTHTHTHLRTHSHKHSLTHSPLTNTHSHTLSQTCYVDVLWFGTGAGRGGG
jgi:hypothetical protein